VDEMVAHVASPEHHERAALNRPRELQKTSFLEPVEGITSKARGTPKTCHTVLSLPTPPLRRGTSVEIVNSRQLMKKAHPGGKAGQVAGILCSVPLMRTERLNPSLRDWFRSDSMDPKTRT
jgi:hypothetical protein